MLAKSSQNANSPTSGVKSLWQSFLGTNAPPQPVTTANANRKPLPAQYPLPTIASAAPASTGRARRPGR